MKIITKISFSIILLAAVAFGVIANQSHNVQADPPTATIQTLDYIEFDGASYIDTGIDQLGDIKVEIDYQYDALTPFQGVFGSRTDTDGHNGFYYGTGSAFNSNLFFGYGDDTTYGAVTAGRNSISTDRRLAVFDNNEFYLGSNLVGVSALPSGSPQTAVNMFLGAISNDGAPVSTSVYFEGKVYSFKIWKGGVLVRDFVPAARYVCGENATVEYGFIDRANGDAWYGNLGTGTLTGSPAVLDTTCPVIPPTPEPTDPLIPGVPATGFHI